MVSSRHEEEIQEYKLNDWGIDYLLAIFEVSDPSDKEHLIEAIRSKVAAVTEKTLKQLDAEFGQHFYSGADFAGYLWYIDETKTMCVGCDEDNPAVFLFNLDHGDEDPCVLWGKYNPVPTDLRFRIEDVREMVALLSQDT